MHFCISIASNLTRGREMPSNHNREMDGWTVVLSTYYWSVIPGQAYKYDCVFHLHQRLLICKPESAHMLVGLLLPQLITIIRCIE